MREPRVVVVRDRDLPASDDWLLPRERELARRFAVPQRLAAWRAGRWAAKQAVAECMDVEPAGVEILPAADGAPEAWAGDERIPVSVSLSHRDGMAVAVATAGAYDAGCDVELVEPRCDGFAADWFTADERTAVELAAPSRRDELVALTWSAKESVLKALRTGLRVDTRRVEVSFARDAFEADTDGKRIRGWWKRDGRFVITAAALERKR